MIARLLGLSGWIGAAMLALCGLALIIGLALPDPVNADSELWDSYGLSVCELPCYAGLLVGETAFEDADAILAGLLPNQNNRYAISGSQVSFIGRGMDITLPDSGLTMPSQYSGSVHYVNEIVGYMTLNFTPPVILYEFMDTMGAPDCLLINSGLGESDGVILVYWEQDDAPTVYAIVLGGDSQDVTLQSLVYSAGIVTDMEICAGEMLSPWRGFAPIWRYEREMPPR
jgi:hypothetical protein